MLDIQNIINRMRQGHGIKRISRDTGVHRATLRRYLKLAKHKGWLEGELPSAATLEAAARVVPDAMAVQISKAEEHGAVIKGLVEKGVQAQAIHGILKDHYAFGGSYSCVQRFVKRVKAVTPTAVVRMESPAGAQAQVDFGDGPRLVDEQTGEVTKTWVFVMVLSYSRHIYVELVRDQAVATWLGCHTRAFAFFGAVPRELVIDNLKAAIVRACFHDPEVQRSYGEFCLYHSTLITPCRVATPRHKGKVERGVGYVKGNALAGREFKTLGAWNEYLRHWSLEVAGTRIHGTTYEKPLERFPADKAAMLPLPATPYEMVVYKEAKVHSDCHVSFEKSFYSAPHRLIRQWVWVCAYERRVQIEYAHERVATHERARRKGEWKTIKAHYPPEKLAGLMAVPTWLREQAREVGASTVAVVEELLSSEPVNKLRTAQSVLKFSKTYGAQRLEAACRRILDYGEKANYYSIKNILVRKLDSQTREQELFARGPVPVGAAYARPSSDLAAHFERKTSWNQQAN
ncbi:MAG: IS21 family transposase [bacterium]